MASLEHIRNIFQTAMHSPYSSFYRDFYRGKIAIDDKFPRRWEEWESLPILTKADIQRVPYEERLYVPKERIYRMHQTSGTTGSGITILPRTRIPLYEDIGRYFDVSSYIGFMYPHSGYEMFTKPQTQFIGGDTARLDMSAALASKIRVDGIAVGSASLAIEFAPMLAKIYETSRITNILLQADVCTSLQRAALKRLYPNAKITMIYLCAEMQGVALFPTLPEIVGEPNALEQTAATHIELKDDAGAYIHERSREGEVVISALREDMALPLFRYTPGDKGVFILRDDTRTVCKIVGRTVNDRLRLSVGQIILAELERAIGTIAPESVVDFQAELREAGEIPLPFLAITLIGSPGKEDVCTIARSIEAQLRITPDRTYADGIARGICAPITCEFISEVSVRSDKKRQRLLDVRAR